MEVVFNVHIIVVFGTYYEALYESGLIAPMQSEMISDFDSPASTFQVLTISDVFNHTLFYIMSEIEFRPLYMLGSYSLT